MQDSDLKVFFCEDCFSNAELRTVVLAHGIPGCVCGVCGSEGKTRLDSTHPVLRRCFRALIRVHYFEWEYNTHMSGEYLSTLLFGENAIMNLGESASAEAFEEAFDAVEDGWYHDPSGVSLGGDMSRSLARSIEPSVGHLIRRALKENYWAVLHDAVHLIETLREDIQTVVLARTPWFRARVGLEKTWVNVEGSYTPVYGYQGYAGTKVGAPPVHLATEGRLNRARESVMYLASDAATAVAEVRPHPGHLVSTATFQNTRPLRVADFARRNVLDFAADRRLEALWKILSLSSFITLPVIPESKHLYLATQLISDAVRLAGFDGVKFRSSVSKGENLVGFSPADFAYVEGSNQVVEVASVTYVTRPVANLRDGDEPQPEGPEPQFTTVPEDAAFFSDLFARRFM